MTKIFHFDGIIKNVSYDPQLSANLSTYQFSDFEINMADSQGIIKLPNERLAYSKWVSPTQEKSYSFSKIYNIYNPVSRRIIIVPVLKDSGADGKLEYMQYSTLSWMNLANVYIVFSYFDKTHTTQRKGRQILIKQELNNEIIRLQIEKLSPYHSSAIHWNRSQFGSRFKEIYKQAIRAYEKISVKTKVELHPRDIKLEHIDKMRKDCRKYEGISIDGLKSADIKNDRSLHENKYREASKSIFYLIDGYGGIYYLSAKDVWRLKDTFIIQETRYSNKNFLPPIRQIQDGLFRLIFFGNIDILYHNGHQVKFQPRLSLFGGAVNGTLYLPCTDKEFNTFARKNRKAISDTDMNTLQKLRVEVEKNQSFAVEIGQKL
jgi:hypothetical protein